VVSAANPYGCNFGFLDRNMVETVVSKYLLDRGEVSDRRLGKSVMRRFIALLFTKYN
jgi:hypothetical protein